MLFPVMLFPGKFPIITFEEYISIALDADRVVGIYPEIKNPIFVNQHVSKLSLDLALHLAVFSSSRRLIATNTPCKQVKWSDGKKLEDRFVETLKKYGYSGSYMSEEWLKQPAFIQSFAPTSLVYISNLTDLPKIFLIDDVTILTEDTNQVSESFSQPFLSSVLHQSSSLFFLMDTTDLCRHTPRLPRTVSSTTLRIMWWGSARGRTQLSPREIITWRGQPTSSHEPMP